jgi:hypothetical protein
MEIISIAELGKRCGVRPETLRMYLCNYTFNPFIRHAVDVLNRSCIGVELSNEFKSALWEFLEKKRGAKFAKKTLSLLDEYDKYKEKIK